MKRLKLRLTERATFGWQALGESFDFEPAQMIELMGQWFATAEQGGGVGDEIVGVIERMRAPQVVIAHGDGAQAAGRDIVNATMEEHVVPAEHSAACVKMLIAALSQKQAPPDFWPAFVAARDAQRKAEEATG